MGWEPTPGKLKRQKERKTDTPGRSYQKRQVQVPEKRKDRLLQTDEESDKWLLRKSGNSLNLEVVKADHPNKI